MPARSKKQQRLMAIAEHNPSKLYKKNKGVTKMSKSQLHDLAATSTKKLPQRKNHKSMSGMEMLNKGSRLVRRK